MCRPRCSAITFAVAGPSTFFSGSSSAGTRSIAHHATDIAVYVPGNPLVRRLVRGLGCPRSGPVRGHLLSRDRPTPRRRTSPHRRSDDGLPDLTVISDTPVTSYVPGRPARPGGPALPPPLLQPQGLPARAAAERRGRDHRPARRAARRACPGAAVSPRAAALRVEDSGIGLTEADVHSLLATIGRSSKRAEGLEAARSDFLGQFGIGLLACFVVAERIRVVSRSARTPDAPPVEWTATDDGSYTVRTLPHEARAGAGHHRAPGGAPGRGRLAGRGAGARAGPGLRLAAAVRRTGGRRARSRTCPAPWDRAYPSPATRRVALAGTATTCSGSRRWTRSTWTCRSPGSAGWRTCCRRRSARPSAAGHRVHLKGMLLTERGRTAAARLGVLRALRPRHGQPAAHRVPRVRCTTTRRWRPCGRRWASGSGPG